MSQQVGQCSEMPLSPQCMVILNSLILTDSTIFIPAGGSAADSIAGISLTSVNYAEVIAVLKKRFGNKQQIEYMDQLLALEAVTSLDDQKGLRHLYDRMEANVRSLKTLGVVSESYGSLLSSVLMKCLPQELCI